MQEVSCEPLMLCPSENPQANLDIFSQPHHHPSRVLHPSQGDKQGLTFLVHCMVSYFGQDCHIICKGRFIPVYRLGEDGDLL